MSFFRREDLKENQLVWLPFNRSAALVAFDEKELVTIPALPDVEVWNRYEQSRLALYPFLSNRNAAARYKRNA